MNNSYTIKDLIALFLGKLWLIIVVTLIGGVIGYCYSRFMLPLEYSSHISMYVQSYTLREDAEQQVNNISNSKQLINTYIQVLKDDAVMEAVSDRLENIYPREILAENFTMQGDNITPSSLRSCISISSVADTSALNINTTTKNPEVAAAICNNLAAVANDYIQQAVSVGSISSIDTAKVYYSPVAPNIPKNTLLGLAAGLMLIMLIILVVDFFDNTIKEASSLSSKYNKAIIGEIPNFGHTGKKKKKKHHDRADLKLTDADVPFAIVESYKSIRTNITFSLSTFDKRIFAVSSPNPGEGKSTTAANIAIAIAQSGRKVLLIDADLRKSVVHKMFHLKNEYGLSTVTSKQAELEECIQHTDIENLDVITSGEVPPNPSELLGSKRMAKILDELAEKYSTIIIDTPPVNVVTDAMELAKYVSGIVMIMRYGKTTTDDIEAAMKKIEFSSMHVLGFVLNDVDTKHHGKYYSKYKGNYYYYSYYGKETNDKKTTNKG